LAYTGKSPNRLNISDANFVDIIHTSSFFGIQTAIGHADFWPNGGAVQPGCSKNVFKVYDCSHARASHLYAESILSRKKFKTSLSCNDTFTKWSQGLKCQCLGICPSMGHYSNENKYVGNFYLRTNGQVPFSID
jgi:hypothetical protein